MTIKKPNKAWTSDRYEVVVMKRKRAMVFRYDKNGNIISKPTFSDIDNGKLTFKI